MYYLTTYEDNSPDAPRIGAYLWYQNLEDMEAGRKPQYVRDTNDLPLHFAHKAEGITVINASTLLVICDDDRYISPIEGKPELMRLGNQSAYYVIGLSY
jgi:hypothetical protein